MPRRIRACSSVDVPEDGRLVLDIGEQTIGIFRVRGSLYAYENTCPHQGGPVCQGTMLPRVVENLNDASEPVGFAFDSDNPRIVCPWHGFEFDIVSGAHPANSAIRLAAIAVEETGSEIYVRL